VRDLLGDGSGAPPRPKPDVILPHGFTPRANQRPVMAFFDRGGKRYSGIWHRRAGKDRVMLAQVSKMAHRRVGTYWHCLPTLKQARKVIWDAITKEGEKLIDITFPKRIVKGMREDDMKIELTCGSIIQLMGADNIESNLGANPLHVTFSEWALTDPQAWNYIRPILRENDGTAAFITTPRGYNHAYDTHEIAKHNAGWMAETYSIYDTGIITHEEYLEEIATGMPEELARQEYLVDFSAANVGSVLGRHVEEAEKAGRIHDGYAYDPLAEVVLSSDIGFRDAAAFWFWQLRPGGFELMDYDEARGLDADDWCDRLEAHFKARGIAPTKIWLPHDARVKTFQSKHSAVERFITRFGAARVSVVPQVKVADRINAARVVLRRCAFHKSHCAVGLRMLRDWHYDWDDEAKVFGREPEHDYASHGADSFTYGSVILQEAVPKAEVKPVLDYGHPAHHAFTLDQLWELRSESQQRKKHF